MTPYDPKFECPKCGVNPVDYTYHDEPQNDSICWTALDDLTEKQNPEHLCCECPECGHEWIMECKPPTPNPALSWRRKEKRMGKIKVGQVYRIPANSKQCVDAEILEILEINKKSVKVRETMLWWPKGLVHYLKDRKGVLISAGK